MEKNMERNKEERLPAIVEEKLEQAYEKIRREEIKQMKKRKNKNRSFMSAAAAVFLIVALPSAVFAATVYYQKSAKQEKDRITYTFEINYELVPGEYQVTPQYLPEGLTDTGHNQYRGENEEWVTIMPIYTMDELDRAGASIEVNGIEKVEHTVLSGMEADIITFPEAKKYQTPTHIYLFNGTEGYVLEIIAGYGLEREELLKLADSLHVERIGNGSYESEEEKAARQKEEADEALLAQDRERTWELFLEAGIPQDKIYGINEEMLVGDGSYGYTVTGYEFLDSIEGFDKEHFFDYTRFEGWVNADGTLKSYTRLQYDENGAVVSEQTTQQEVLRVDLKIHCYQSDENMDAALNFSLAYVDKREDASYTWAKNWYGAVPEENYELQMDDSAVWFDKAVYTQPGERQNFFFRHMENGEELSYTLLFIVDKDRKDSFLLQTVSGNSAIWSDEILSVKEIQDRLDGYIQLQ